MILNTYGVGFGLEELISKYSLRQTKRFLRDRKIFFRYRDIIFLIFKNIRVCIGNFNFKRDFWEITQNASTHQQIEPGSWFLTKMCTNMRGEKLERQFLIFSKFSIWQPLLGRKTRRVTSWHRVLDSEGPISDFYTSKRKILATRSVRRIFRKTPKFQWKKFDLMLITMHTFISG